MGGSIRRGLAPAFRWSGFSNVKALQLFLSNTLLVICDIVLGFQCFGRFSRGWYAGTGRVVKSLTPDNSYLRGSSVLCRRRSRRPGGRE